jgi:4-amino-4-deoxy-L-arabinose transferase
VTTGTPDDSARREWWTFFAFALVFAFAGQWMRGLWETDEGRYSECAREMVASGDWLHPTLQGRPHLTKPPGAYWLIAAGLELFGRNEFGARFFLGLAFVASAVLVRRIGEDLCGAAAGSRAGWIFLTMLLPAVSGNTVSTDMFLLAFVLAAVACLFRAWTSAHAAAWLAASGAALGIAFFVKGPPVLLPFAAVVIGWAVVARSGAFSATRRATSPQIVLGTVFGVLAFAILGLWWFLWMVAEDASRLDYWLHGEVYERVFTNVHSRDKPLWFYFAVIVGGTLPWTWHAIRGARAAWRDAAGRVVLVWLVVPFVGFEISTSKMWFYLLPLAAPAAVLAAMGTSRRESPLPARAGLLAAWMIVLVGLRTGLAFLPDERNTKQMRELIARVEPTGKLPVALLSGANMWGLQFQYDGRLRYLSDPLAVTTGHADATLAEEYAARRATGEDWSVIVDPGNGERAMKRVGGDAAETLFTSDEWVIYRVRGK